MRRTHQIVGMLLVMAATSVALAYAPHPGFILSLSAGKRTKQRLNATRVVVKRTDYVGEQPQDPRELTITLREGGRVREEWTDKDGKHARISDGTRLLLVDGEKKEKGTPEPDLLYALWASGGEATERELAQERALKVMKAWGVAESPVAFSRMDGRVAWVIGAESRNLEVPQLWIDKDDFLPLRVLHRDVVAAPPPPAPTPDGGPAPEPAAPPAATGALVDIRYRNWGSATGGEFFPGRIETYRDGLLVRVDELVKVDVTPKIDERDFKLE
ncbi:MAG: hypothetical protein AB2A00_28810 [Myxococcota bacterium]